MRSAQPGVSPGASLQFSEGQKGFHLPKRCHPASTHWRIQHLPVMLDSFSKHQGHECWESGTHLHGGNVHPWIDWIQECNSFISVPGHRQTSPATAPTHCLSKKWLKIWTSHTSVLKSELGCHARLVMSIGGSQITGSERSGEPQRLRATPGSAHMDFAWHSHLPQAHWHRIPVPLQLPGLSSRIHTLCDKLYTAHGFLKHLTRPRNSSFIYTHLTPLPGKWKYSQTSELLGPWILQVDHVLQSQNCVSKNLN